MESEWNCSAWCMSETERGHQCNAEDICVKPRFESVPLDSFLASFKQSLVSHYF